MRNSVLVLAFFALVSAAPLAGAAEQKQDPAAAVAEVQLSGEPEKKTRPLPFQGKVFRVDLASNLFVTRTKAGKEHVFHLTEKSKILKGEASATLADIRSGETVRGSRIKLGENTWEVVKVIIGAKAATEKSGGSGQQEERE